MTIRDVEVGEHLTIDYACFDSNTFICIERCLCGSDCCRRFVRGDDYRITELQTKYRGHFLPYIQKKIDDEAALVAKNGPGVVGGAGGPNGDFSAASVQAYHESHPVDVEANNRAGLAALIARFAPVAAAGSAAIRAAELTKKRVVALPPPTSTASTSGSDDSSSSSASSTPPLEDSDPVPILAKAPFSNKYAVLENEMPQVNNEVINV